MTTSTSTPVSLAILAAPDLITAKAQIKAPSVTSASSLLETVRALDGSKADRYAVALSALTSAYTQALQHGNKTQLTQVVESTGKKVCERAMRTAVQVVGVPSVHKVVATRQDAIDSAVVMALDIFAGIACAERAPKPARKDKNSDAVTVKSVVAPVADTDTNSTTDGEAVTLDVGDMVSSLCAAIAAGMLSNDELDSLQESITLVRLTALTASESVASLTH